MAVDRLAAMRAAQQQENPGSNSYPTQASGNGGYQGYQSRRPNPYAQQDERSYEMSSVTTSGPPGDMSFYDQITFLQGSIQKFNENVERIGVLHTQALDSMDGTAQANTNQLDELVRETSDMSNELKRRIKSLEAQGGAPRDAQIRKQQIALVKSKFVEAIQKYQGVEQQNRAKHKLRIERQFKIVKPDATADEVRAIVNDTEGGQVFTQALLQSQSRTTYREVQARHEDIKRIEKTLAELAQLFNDMSVLVNQQEETIEAIETQAATVEQDTEAGLKHTTEAVRSARAARKKRWICFFILILVIVIIAASIGGYYASQNRK